MFSSGEALRSARWYSSWLLVLSLVPVVCLYAVWIPLTCSGKLKPKRKRRSRPVSDQRGKWLLGSYQNISSASLQSNSNSSKISRNASTSIRRVDSEPVQPVVTSNNIHPDYNNKTHSYQSQSNYYSPASATLPDVGRGGVATSIVQANRKGSTEDQFDPGKLHSSASYLRMEDVDWIEDELEGDEEGDADSILVI